MIWGLPSTPKALKSFGFHCVGSEMLMTFPSAKVISLPNPPSTSLTASSFSFSAIANDDVESLSIGTRGPALKYATDTMLASTRGTMIFLRSMMGRVLFFAKTMSSRTTLSDETTWLDSALQHQI